MKKYYCESIDDILTVYVKDENGNKKIISTNHDDIIKGIENISSLNTYVRIYAEDVELFCFEKRIAMFIVDYGTLLLDDRNRKLEDSIKRACKNGYIRKESNLSLSKPKKSGRSFMVRTVMPLVLAGGISIMSLSPFQVRTKKNIDNKVYDSDKTIVTEILSPEEIPTDKKVILKVDENSAYTMLNQGFSSSIQDKEEPIIESPVEEVETSNTIDISHKKESLMEYFSTDSIDAVDNFLGEFVTTMKEYGGEYTLDDVTDIFFEVSNIPIETKVEYVKNAFNLDDNQIDAVAATLVAEGVGFGGKYIDVYAATTTALNHLQFPIWVYSISNVRGEELGHSIYGHTCYASQFNAYGSNNYYTFLGKRDLTGYKSVIDTLYVNSVYGLILHNYCQFRGAWIDVPNGKIYETGGNKYIEPLKAADRVVETSQKNNSIL